MLSPHHALTRLSFLALAIALITLEGGARADKAVELVPGCFRKGHKVTCRSWSSADAPDIPFTFSWRDFLVLDLSSVETARKMDIMTRGGTCDKQGRARALPPQGLGAALPEGRLPARWLSSRYSTLIVLYMRGAGLRAVHPDSFEMLSGVQHVYLDSNLLEHLDPDMWRHNPLLTGVSLENNLALQLPEEESLFQSDSIEYVDLSGCGLRALPAGVFDGMPRLQTLHLERNCLRAVPTQALVPVADLWSTVLGENAIQTLSADDAQLLAGLPDALMHGNPWRCDCALRDTLRALEGTTRSFWEQTMPDLVCHWPPEDLERSWAEVLTRNSCRVYNDSIENSSSTSTSSSGSSLATLPPPLSTGAPPAEAAAALSHSQEGCGSDGDAVFCKWTAAGALLFLVLSVITFVVAVFTDRLAITISVACARRGRKAERRLSQANLTDAVHDNAEYLQDEDHELGARDRRFVVHFG